MKIGLFGTGAYGMAISSILIDNHCEVTMWTKIEEEKNELEKTRMNEKRLPGFRLDDSIKITTNVEECIKDKDLLMIAIPAAFVDALCVSMAPYINNNHNNSDNNGKQSILFAILFEYSQYLESFKYCN